MCFKHRKSAAVTFALIQISYEKNCLYHGNDFEWYICFKNGRELLEEYPREWLPSTSTMATIELASKYYQKSSYGLVWAVVTPSWMMYSANENCVPGSLTAGRDQVSLDGLMTNHISYRILLQAMNRGVSSTIRRLNAKRLNGVTREKASQWKIGPQCQKWKQYWSHSLIQGDSFKHLIYLERCVRNIFSPRNFWM